VTDIRYGLQVLTLTYIAYYYASCLQRKVYSSCEGKVPRELEDQSWDLETFEKSRRYGLDKNSYTMFSLFYYTIVWTVGLYLISEECLQIL